MATPRFDRAFGRLVAAFDRYRVAPRSPSQVPELGRRRFDLGEARSEMASVRKSEGVIFADPPTPDWVDPSLGSGSASKAGLISLVIAVLVVVGGGLAIARLGSSGLSIEQESVVGSVATTEQGCVWRVDFSAQNNTQSEIHIQSIVMSGHETNAPLSDLSPIGPKADAELRWERSLATCPVTAPDATSRHMTVRYTVGDDTTVRFTSIDL